MLWRRTSVPKMGEAQSMRRIPFGLSHTAVLISNPDKDEGRVIKQDRSCTPVRWLITIAPQQR